MRPPKNPKKSSDEDRSRKKKIKSRSARRRRDPSISSNASSSEFELDSRSWRKSSKSKKLEKRGKESKKSERRKSGKKRYRRDSSVSSFSSDSGRRSCSTCSDSERSRSPVRKSKSRKGKRERVRKSSRRRLESRRSSRYRSRSCSTCSKSRGHSRSRSPIEGRHGSSRGRSSRYRSPSCSTCSGGRSRSRSPIEERYGSSHARSPLVEESPHIEERFGSSPGRSRYMEEGVTKRLRSVLAVTKTSDGDEDKIIEAYDDYPRSNEGYDDEGNKKRNLDVGNWEKDSYGTRTKEDVLSSKNRGQPVKDSDVGGGVTKDYLMRKENEVVGEDGGKEADDLELILRRKALENFKKFRGVRPANKESLSDKTDKSSKLESSQGSQSFMKTSESNPHSSLDDQRHVQGGIHPNKLKSRSVANIPTEKINGNAVHDLSNDTGGFKPVASSITDKKNTLNQFKRVQESSDNILSEESSLTKESQNKKIVALPDSGEVSRAEIDTADKPAPDALNAENRNCRANEPMVESASGSQFEQKTFSRMCDRETVQVSYKVYIPKKTPALARRQLQR